MENSRKRRIDRLVDHIENKLSIKRRKLDRLQNELLALDYFPQTTSKHDVSTNKKDLLSTLKDLSSTLKDISTSKNDISTSTKHDASFNVVPEHSSTPIYKKSNLSFAKNLQTPSNQSTLSSKSLF